MTKLDAGLMTSLPASDPDSAAVCGSKKINPRPQFCFCLAWSGCPSNDDDDQFKKRFSFNGDRLIAKFNVLDPNESFTQNRSPSSIIPIAAHFSMPVPEVSLNDLDDQWRNYRTNVDSVPAVGDCIIGTG